MLELTLTTGTELKIGDDIRIVFKGDTTSGRMKVAVEAPREKRIERIKAPEKHTKPGKIFIVKGEESRGRADADGRRGYRDKEGMTVQ